MSYCHPDQQPLDSEGGSRPSYANCPDSETATETAQNQQSDETEASAIPRILDNFQESFPDLARLAVSMVPRRKLREECVREIRGHRRGEKYKSRLVHGVLKAFLRWYTAKEGEEIIFEADDGSELRVDAPNSYSDDYGRKWYGRLKDTERALVYDAPKPHTAMLSFTASTTDADGNPRPPADHLKHIQKTWSNHSRKALQRGLEAEGFTERYYPEKHSSDGPIDLDVRSGLKMVCDDDEPVKWWDYVTVVEPHGGGGDATGYAHFHVAVITSHPISETALRQAVEKHVEKCAYAAPEAHDEDAVSVNAIEPGAEPEHDDTEDIGNLGSYLSEYVGGFSGPLEDRPLYELLFQATCWATNTKRVRRSNGAGRLEERGRRLRDEFDDAPPSPDYGYDSREWQVRAIEDGDGECHPPSQKGTSFMIEILTENVNNVRRKDDKKGQPPPSK